MPRQTVWNGTSEEMFQLALAIEHNEAQKAFHDQRFLDGMLWGRWMRDRLIAEEATRLRRKEVGCLAEA